MPAPMLPPSQRPAPEIRAAGDYQPGEPVWVYRFGRWCPGQVWQASARAVGVRYRPARGGGVSADTVTADQVAPRAEVDQLLDLAPDASPLPTRPTNRPAGDSPPGRG